VVTLLNRLILLSFNIIKSYNHVIACYVYWFVYAPVPFDGFALQINLITPLENIMSVACFSTD